MFLQNILLLISPIPNLLSAVPEVSLFCMLEKLGPRDLDGLHWRYNGALSWMLKSLMILTHPPTTTKFESFVVHIITLQGFAQAKACSYTELDPWSYCDRCWQGDLGKVAPGPHP